MEIIALPNGAGKTDKLIQLSALYGYMIVCRTMETASQIFHRADKQFNLTIPFPLSYDEFVRGMYYGKGIKGFLIDDTEDLIQYISTGVPVIALTFTTKEETDGKQ